MRDIRHPWFAVQEVAPRTWLIAEPGHVNFCLVEGTERAALLDTGLGIAPVAPLVAELTRLPVVVVNTHAHFDHVGGNREFRDIAIHEAGVERLRRPAAPELLAGYFRYMQQVLDAAEAYRALDRRFFFLIEDISNPRPLPPSFRAEDWRIGPSEPTRTLHEGDRIALGGRDLLVLHTPGHSADSICLIDEAAGILFAGDTINTGPIYAQLPDSDMSDFARSTARLASLAGGLRLVLAAHFGRAVLPPAILAEIAGGFAQVLDGRVAWHAAQDAVGRPVRQARFARFSILAPPEAAADARP